MGAGSRFWALAPNTEQAAEKAPGHVILSEAKDLLFVCFQ
jgi:hypothetical protein